MNTLKKVKKLFSKDNHDVPMINKVSFRCRRIPNPFQPVYEIEWQHQWLPLDSTTSQYIERMRRKGFSRVAIRNDTRLIRLMNKKSELDILLELSLTPFKQASWWTMDHVGEAYLPDWMEHYSEKEKESLQYTMPPHMLE
ncbi:uncharacterized protein B0P05DRAFT_555170 [Gilbertella persicaria]|uniref:uncharacterized protein n=1 Tax=Gilbertella persicaria TaxID=101096 RepID=UPI00222068B4|nr:uncharacterized protein B0P05DRAFT_555170 [Gilbertella persicaria]KAI8063651.1 hypothetical protein B0P05DRAFT_555170 [Gilbertella persicaria]